MLRRSVVALAKPAVQQTGRTIVRDPRKQRAAKEAAAKAVVNQPPPPPPAPRLTDAGPLPNLNQNQHPMGLGSYVLAGAGVALGFAFVGALLGVDFLEHQNLRTEGRRDDLFWYTGWQHGAKRRLESRS